jgi:ribonuclease VapC
MVVDSSALFAITFNEPERLEFIELILSAAEPAISASTLLECRLVALRRAGADWDSRLLTVMQRLQLRVVAFDEPQAAIAAEAFRLYGKGRHPAALNFGDCFSYALAKAVNEPLLYKGEDFRKTDLRSVL